MAERSSFPLARTDGRQLFPRPRDGETVLENPPVFSWLALPDDRDDHVLYRVTVWDGSDNVVWQGETTGNSIYPDCTLPVGTYRWDVEADGAQPRGKQSFTVSADATVFLRPTVDAVIAGIPSERPRHLFCRSDIEKLLRDNPEAAETLRRNAEEAMRHGLPERPMFHRDPDALPYREYFGRFRDYCDRDLVALSLTYALFDDAEAGKEAKKRFFHIADWNPAGPCSLTGPWGDEVGLSLARTLPSVFDLLYPLFDEKEVNYAAETVKAYAIQCEERLARLQYTQNPGDSHAGRLPAYLGEAALALWGVPRVDPAMLRRWLDTALRIYGGIFPYYGCDDGGWAEGTFYSASYTKWYLPFFAAVARYTGTGGYFVRPFYRNYARFLLHFALPDHEIHPFGDGYWCRPESEEWPGFFAQDPFRVYAALSGIEDAKRYDRELSRRKLFSLHLLDLFLPVSLPDDGRHAPEVTNADAFPESGFVSLHSDRTDLSNDLHLIAHATPFGPGSHRQPDQGSFALFLGGKALISPSGYFGRGYGTKHHMGWYNTTKAHNAILVDGVGQNYRDFTHTGKVVSCTDDGNVRTAVLDLSDAYPTLRSWTRTFRLCADRVTVTDEIAADHPAEILYPLHTLSRPEKEEGSGLRVTVTRGNARLDVIPADGCFTECTLSDRFDVDLNEGVPEPYRVSMPEQFHVYYKTPCRECHTLSVTFYTRKI